MPRNVRNFWLDAEIDGRRTTLSGGPVSRDGGFRATFYMRDNGGVVRALAVEGMAKADGTLTLNVLPYLSDGSGAILRGFDIRTQSGRR